MFQKFERITHFWNILLLSFPALFLSDYCLYNYLFFF